MTEESLFAAALAIPDPAARAAYLDRACPDPAARRGVDALLAAHAASNPLDRPPAVGLTGAYVPADGPAAAVGDRVGPYRLLERIGEGGMGEVWVAEQTEPLRRRVAVKLVKPGMDSRSVLARFEAERQALAVMDHPNIARVIDAGTTDSARPYFVMELVKGVPITEFCDARRLTPRERLGLFVPVCRAIQHAHMKGVIHRDSKPSNVLVALHDETPVPKVIDFGIAKAVGQPLTERTIYTGFGALVGTPAYMAPEQATFNQLDVDTRADVYALGVLLYELLAGSPPVEPERLRKAALDEVLRIVRDEEPPRPSQRLSTAAARASIAAVRGTEPAKLSALVRGELDWIVMKALEKDRGRRYETANGLAEDVRRYLDGEAVAACPPTLGYRLRKAYRRNRAAVWVAAAVLAVTYAGACGVYFAYTRAVRAEAAADRNADAFRGAMVKADTALQEVERVTADQQVDAALRADGRVGLLTLVRTLRTLAPTDGFRRYPLDGGGEIVLRESDETAAARKALREFVTAAVVSLGQEFVPLVPPLRIESWPDGVSPDHRLYIGGDERDGLELLTLPYSTRVGVLREGTERVLQYGFSPDGKTVFTQDSDSVVRFWNTDGTLRAKTPVRPERYVYPPGMTRDEVQVVARNANPVLVADGVAVLRSVQFVGVTPAEGNPDWRGKPGRDGPADLYSTRTGRFIRRLDQPGRRTSDWKLSPDKRWLVYVEESRQAVIVSADDGRELARLDHPEPGAFLQVDVSPTGKWVMTTRNKGVSDRQPPSTEHVRLWSSATWQPVRDAALQEALERRRYRAVADFVTDDVVGVSTPNGIDATPEGVFRLGRPGSWMRYADIGYSGPEWEAAVGERNGTLIRCGRVLTDAVTLERLRPPLGRKYHPALATLAPDGRFWSGLDTVTEKDIPGYFGHDHVPGLGLVAVRTTYDDTPPESRRDYPELRVRPDADRLGIPAALLELWAGVVAGGELGPDGRFQPWDQPTWAAKQRELAAAKPPYPDFPFPGWAAAEPDLWYFVRAYQLRGDDTLLSDWRRRTAGPRPAPGPDPWRTTEPAPPPRPAGN
jgi:serine/threonine protein kinase